jgi:hypothetical protein
MASANANVMLRRSKTFMAGSLRPILRPDANDREGSGSSQESASSASMMLPDPSSPHGVQFHPFLQKLNLLVRQFSDCITALEDADSETESESNATPTPESCGGSDTYTSYSNNSSDYSTVDRSIAFDQESCIINETEHGHTHRASQASSPTFHSSSTSTGANKHQRDESYSDGEDADDGRERRRKLSPTTYCQIRATDKAQFPCCVDENCQGRDATISEILLVFTKS